MQLYTVKMTTKRLMSRFNERGVKIEDVEISIPVTFHDLPLQTAQMYKEKNPDGNVQIVAQVGIINSEKSRSGQYAPSVGRSVVTPRSQAKPTAVKSKERHKDDAVQNAARSGDMTAAINQR